MYISVTSVRRALGPWGPPGIQNDVSYCFVDAVFEAVVREVIDMDKSTTSFLEERLTAAPRLVQFV